MGIFRVICAIAVILAHVDTYTQGFKLFTGDVAVEFFFIISGFYMTLILNSKYTSTHSYKLFITNRFLRIFPIYWLILIITVLFSLTLWGLLGDWGPLSIYKKYHSCLGFLDLIVLVISQLIIFGQDIVNFITFDINNGHIAFVKNFVHTDTLFSYFLIIPQAWTLSLELVFYLIAPFILRRNYKLILFLLIASLSLKIYLYYGLKCEYVPWNYRFFPAEFCFFLSGYFSYKIYSKIQGRKKYWLPSLILSILFLLLIIPYHYIPIIESVKRYIYFGVLVICLPFIFNLTKNSRIDNRVGELSYPMYIVHYLVILIIGILPINNQLINFKIILTIVITVIVSCFLLKYVSDPIEEFRQLRWAKQQQSKDGAQ